MNLIEKMMETFCFMEKTRVPDGEGGFTTTWKEGVTFSCAIVMDTTMQAIIAQSQGVKSVYTITTSKSVELDYNDVIKRVTDGKIFRITSDKGDKASPSISSLDMAQFKAEKWSLT